MCLRYRLKLFVLLVVLIICHGCTTTVPAPVSSKSTAKNRPDVTTGRSVPEAQSAVSPKTYKVKKGDTLYSIAWRYKHDYRDVARWNEIQKPFTIFPGQVLRLTPNTTSQIPVKPLQPGPIVSKQAGTKANKSKVAKTATAKKNPQQPGPVTSRKTKPQSVVANIKWQWPASASLLKSNTRKANKGVDFNGKQGQKIFAAASGEVVYSGSGLLGYGKLVIIKHNDRYLSAYAYNKKILVREGQNVTAGQQIATMGIGIKGLPTLHFEIRKDGKPTNPLQYLPRQKT